MTVLGKLRRFTDEARNQFDFNLCLAAAMTVIRHLVTAARYHERWVPRPPPDASDAQSTDHLGRLATVEKDCPLSRHL